MLLTPAHTAQEACGTRICHRRRPEPSPLQADPWRRLLQLQQQGGALDLHQGVDVLQPGLHQRQPALDTVVAEGDLLPHNLLRRGDEIAGEELHKLVLHVLDKVEARTPVPLHDKHRQVAVWLLDAVVQHLDDHRRVVLEVDHQLLMLLHCPEALLIHPMRVVEEEVILAGQLNPAVLRGVFLPQGQDLAPNCFERAHLLRAGVRVLHA
mmetsp:Transcript_58612/g.181603  ORF Transcript_58612/g.181603 Transcript_58612/m.181603 type:complete len:209 (+) Transcript_58612:3-629(+)